ncbi:hypothetical protein R83H12_00868 [Fibrobacteria bacterium R8-3-H12]
MKATRSTNPVNPLIGKIGVQTILAASLALAITFTLSCSDLPDINEEAAPSSSSTPEAIASSSSETPSVVVSSSSAPEAIVSSSSETPSVVVSSSSAPEVIVSSSSETPSVVVSSSSTPEIVVSSSSETPIVTPSSSSSNALVAGQIWNGTADTTWYTAGNNKIKTEYSITTAEQLAGLASLVSGTTSNGKYNMSGKLIKLGADILLNDTTDWQNWIDVPPTNIWKPIGSSSNAPFKGTFDGNGHIISGVYFNNNIDYQGLFGYIDGAKIKNIGVTAFYIFGKGYVGGLVGRGNATIDSSYTTGNVVGTANYVGGLVGYNSGSNSTISNSYSTGNVVGTANDVGGLVGYNSGSNSTISNSYSTGNVVGTGYVGGLVGENSGTISNSYSTGNVTGTGTNTYAGSLVGRNGNGGTISNSYSSGNVSGIGNYVGFVGSNTGTLSTGTIENSKQKTTAEMQTEEFATTLGTAFKYNAGGYPKLVWE